jgi:hypothetical protein
LVAISAPLLFCPGFGPLQTVDFFFTFPMRPQV